MAAKMLTGMWRIVHMDANDIPLGVIMEKHYSEFGGSVGSPEIDAQKMPKFKRGQSPILKEDEKLVLQFRPDVAVAEASSGNSHTRFYRIPVTFHNIRSGHAFEKTLTANDFVEQNPTAASKAWVAGQWVAVDEYKIGSQSELVLGHGLQDVRVDSAIRLQFDVVAA